LISQKILDVARCPRCVDDNDITKGKLETIEGGVMCRTCGLAYGAFRDSGADERTVSEGRELPRRGYLDLFPRDEHGEHTRYLEEEFEHSLDYEHISLPLLGAGVRNDMLRKLLKPRKSDLALEVGCGDGRFCFWNRHKFGAVVGLDAAPLFAHEALDLIPLVRGDGRRLPFATGSFDKVFSLDLMEHLPAEGIVPFFSELRRVLKPGGRIFIFSNTREMGKLWWIIKLEKRVANFFAKRGMFDFHRDELRKSDHIKAVTTWEDLENYLGQAGLVVEQKVFWNGVFQGLVDNIIVKAGEYIVRRAVRRNIDRQREIAKQRATENNKDVRNRLFSGRTGITSDWADGGGMERMRAEMENNQVTRQAEQVAARAEQHLEENAAIDLAVRQNLKRDWARTRRGPVLFVLKVLTFLMKLDIWFWGRLRTGPFFITAKSK
jgi:SAM-dependent methyltransferase